MKKGNIKSKNPVVLVLYGVSILLGIYTIFTMYSSYTYISSLVAQGLVITDELQSVITYFGTASIPYLFYSIATWAIGYIINKLNYISYEIKKTEHEDLEEEIIIEDTIDVVNDEIEVADEVKK
ncbi:hypothetical protein [Romboutsia sp.]|uniref:hypothetical protein n=1 Tax=Romboutsia sp. TaxID=1965302 RepID=UPI003F39F89F